MSMISLAIGILLIILVVKLGAYFLKVVEEKAQLHAELGVSLCEHTTPGDEWIWRKFFHRMDTDPDYCKMMVAKYPRLLKYRRFKSL